MEIPEKNSYDKNKMIEYLKILLDKYKNKDLSFPKEYLSREVLEDYRYLNRINEIIIRKLSLMIEWLETGIVPKEDFGEIIRISNLIKDPIINIIESQIIEVQNGSSEIHKSLI